MQIDRIEVGVVGPALLRQAVVSLLAGQPELRIADPGQAQVWIEVGANPTHRSPGGPVGSFILVGAPPDRARATDLIDAGAYIGFDESLAALREAILAVASLTRKRANAA